MQINYERRNFGLDLIRAIAILLVMTSHSTILLFPENDSTIVSIIQFFGAIGVDLFFVLSGYLIGGILLRKLKQDQVHFRDLLRFWVRRWFRTLPNYFLILLINIILAYILFKDIISEKGQYVLFLQNFAAPHPDFFTEAWTLSIEEYSYILGPFLLYFLLFLFKKRFRIQLYLLVSVTVILAISLLRLNFHLENEIQDYSYWSHHLRKVVIYRLDAIYYGFVAIYIAKFHSEFWYKNKNLILILGCVLFFEMHLIMFIFHLLPENSSLFFNFFYLPLLGISLLMFFPKVITIKWKGLMSKIITKISIWSYALYLVNYSIVLLTISFLIDIPETSAIQKVLILSLYWVSSFVLAYILYRFYEYPMTNLRDSKAIKSLSKS